MTAGQTWPGRRVNSIADIEKPCDYFGPDDGYTGDMPAVFFLKPNSRDEGAPPCARSIQHVCSPPHTFHECENGSLTISPSIGDTVRGSTVSDGWHGYLVRGEWRQVLWAMAKSIVRKVVNIARPIPFNSRWNNNGGLYGSGTQDRFTYLQTMGMQGTLFAIIQLLSTGAQSSGDWQLFRKDRDGRVRYTTSDRGSDQRVEVLRHQALRLWNRPNAFMTGAEFREIGWQFMELVGEWYWVMNRGPTGKGIPIEMWPVRPDRMEPVPDKENFLAGWVYTGPNGEAVPLEVSEVIQLKYPHPTDPYRGLSAVQGLLADIDAAKYSAEWSRNFFLNSAQPGGIVTFSKRLSDDEFNEFTARWREQHQGVARGHRVGVLEQGATWTPNTYSMRDMQFADLRKITSDMIRQAYRIHQAMLGNSDDVNRANAQTAEEVHVAWHEVSRLKRERGALNSKYLEMFGDEDRVEFDFKDPMPSSVNDANDELEAKTKAAQLMIEAGFDPEDVLEMTGLPAMKYIGPPKAAPSEPTSPRPALSRPDTPSEDVRTGEIGEAPETEDRAVQNERYWAYLLGEYQRTGKPPHVTGWGEPDDGDVRYQDIGALIREAFSEVKSNGNGHRKELV